MTRMQLHRFIIVALIATTSSFVYGEESLTEEDWATFNQHTVTQHIIPRYKNLEEKAETLVVSVDAFCETPGEDTLASARKYAIHAMMAWQAIQHVQFGPVTHLMRNFSLEYWPDKKGIGAKQLRAALQDKEAAFDESYFADASVSLKGFPALEKVLFSDTVVEDLTANSTICAFITGMVRNMHQMTTSIASDWTAAAASIDNAGVTSEDYEDVTDASTQILKSLIEPVAFIREDKLIAVLGDSPASTRWKRSEFWRSRQSVNSLRVNMQGLQHLYSGWDQYSVRMLLQKSGDEALAAKLDEDFKSISLMLAEMHEPLLEQITDEEYASLAAMAEALYTLQQDLEKALDILDINTGFNSRDGD